VTGIAAAALTAAGVTVLVLGTAGALVVADLPAAVYMTAGLGLPGLPAAGLLLRGYLRFRRQSRPRHRRRRERAAARSCGCPRHARAAGWTAKDREFLAGAGVAVTGPQGEAR